MFNVSEIVVQLEPIPYPTDATHSAGVTLWVDPSYGLNGTSVTPSISLSPHSGPAGTSVTVAGSNLIASHNLTVTYDGSTAGMPTTCTTDASGNITSGCAFIVPFSDLGSHTITASDGTNSPTVTFTLTPVDVTCSKPIAVVGSAITCKATVREFGTRAPTGTVRWSSGGSGTFSRTSCRLSKYATYSACSVKYTPPAAGSAVITASYGGDSHDPATTGTHTLTVSVKPTTMKVSCARSFVVANSTAIITCRAKVTGYLPTGNVTWTQNGTGSVSLITPTCMLSKVSLSLSSCSVTLRGAKPGSVAVNASYGGDSNNTPGSRIHELTVGKALTTVAIACPSTTLSVGVPLTCTATASGYFPAGTVTWAKVLGTGGITFSPKTCNLSLGSCTVTVTATRAGSIRIKAAYSGDPNNRMGSGTLVLIAT